ncbi:MAG: hypothetical protein HC880_02830 [Bacteroidia bacterium]|nr:hypothetical protein [Bacteroidia bacterium]
MLLATISDTDAKKFANIPDFLLDQERSLKSEIAYYEQKLSEGANEAESQNYRKHLFNLNREYEDFIKALEQAFPQYYNLKYNVNTSQISAIQQVLDDQSELLSYFLAPRSGRLYIFRINFRDLK